VLRRPTCCVTEACSSLAAHSRTPKCNEGEGRFEVKLSNKQSAANKVRHRGAVASGLGRVRDSELS
jgi:hypothetical protein